MKKVRFVLISLALTGAFFAAWAGKRKSNLQVYRVVSYYGTFRSPTKYIVQTAPITEQVNPLNYVCDQVPMFCTITVDVMCQAPVSEGNGLSSFIPQMGVVHHDIGEYIPLYAE